MGLERTFRTAWGLVGLLALLVAAGGCSTDDSVPRCENCEIWSPVTAGLGRFPELHPSDPSFLVFSTIEKTQNAPDSNQEADEDIWLLHRGETPAENTLWQLTDNALGFGDNSAARWSPSGTQIAFAHSTADGAFEIWRMRKLGETIACIPFYSYLRAVFVRRKHHVGLGQVVVQGREHGVLDAAAFSKLPEIRCRTRRPDDARCS